MRFGLIVALVLGAGCREPNPAFLGSESVLVPRAPGGEGESRDLTPGPDGGPGLPGTAPGPGEDAGSPLPGPGEDAGSPLPGPGEDAGSPLPGPDHDGALPIAPDTGAPPTSPGGDLRTGVVGFWSFDETAGSSVATDRSGNGNHGQVQGLDPAAAWVPGRSGTALDFPSTASSARVWVSPSPSLDGITQAFTIALWLYLSSDSTVMSRTLLSRAHNGDDHIYELRLTGTRPSLEMPYDANGDEQVSGGAVGVGRWTHLAASYDGASMRLFVDGAQVAARTYGRGLPQTSRPLLIGSEEMDGPSPPNQMVGLLDDVLLYGRALPPSDIAALAAGARP